MWIRGLAAGLCLAGLAVGCGAARACGIDNIPSLSVNGRLVVVNTSTAGAGAIDTWTPFLARGAYRAHHTMLLKEDRAEVARALALTAFRYPWRWRFGDGTMARGASVRHVYLRPGVYVIAVDAYLVAGTQKLWFTFDRATIRVR